MKIILNKTRIKYLNWGRMPSFAFCLHMALLIIQYGMRGSSYYRERGNLKHVVLVFWVEGQGAISGDWLMILLMQIKTTTSLIDHSVLINGKAEDS